MRKNLVFLLLLVSTASFAADRNAKIRSLMEAQGLLTMVQQQMDMYKQQGREQSKQMLDQMLSGLNPPPEFRSRLLRAWQEFVAALEMPWTAQDFVDVWAKFYGAAFSDSELDQLLAFYRSPLGKKEVAASQKALPELSAYLAEQSKPVVDRAMAKYISDLKTTVAECKCRK